jgi:uncharacterized BrkB/YihY/UPF0761 family membrane protein
MNKTTLKSIWAILAGFIFVVAISIITDLILEKTGIMKQPFDENSWIFIVFVILYRNVYGVIGSYITAKLAPNLPMRHAMIGGFIGLVLATIGAIVMWHIPPHWYAISLIILALPSAWLGGKIWENQLSK